MTDATIVSRSAMCILYSLCAVANLKCGAGPPALESPGKWVEMQILGPHRRSNPNIWTKG